MNKKLFYISFLCFLFSGMLGYAQTRKELENRRKKLNKEIEKVNDLLFKTKKEKTSALDDLKDINQKITVRERLIETIELETKELSKEIKSNEHKLNKLNNELTVLKDDYADMVVKSYKSKSQQSKTMFLLSSKSFYQAYKRLKYMEQYKNYRKKQGEDIALKSDEIQAVNDSLKKQKKAKELLITSEQKQKKEIEGDKKEQEGLVSKIKKQESKYKRELEKKIKEEKALAKKIDKLIRDAIAKANKAKKGKAKKDELLLSAEEKTLKANFEQNKGNLPWPVNGLITRKFGVQPHPTFKGITINSTGLHIRGKSGDKAKTVFNGKVLAVQLLSKGRKAVLVQHGDYITAYNGLKEVFVNVGQKVKTGDALGKIFTDKVTGKTDLGFVLFKNINRLDPSDWIENR
ncbi:murein hydrolase activator EnvC family protein [Tenacibaculum sp. IB213877]|uniref:murein hydrolase activator EnvC family protein n=1 Tax=Tenacibaculum sp. IB213877 TaxID=3097351 RepID=UPI002A59C482|nr:peptidoglycan DD-metalloendopeptidase family protein [Tenacibaculum sp. IB213877]MDY0780500.1 peptidoglycan DD-metalloendopeptidase family protein [Tenacibaculum sp. IB213877]